MIASSTFDVYVVRVGPSSHTVGPTWGGDRPGAPSDAGPVAPRDLGRDMKAICQEAALGSLAVNVNEC
ncbi:hypothetical protein [Streptomyces sp. NPDC055400]